LTIDNHINVGDALIEYESLNVPFGSGSTVVGTAIVNGIRVKPLIKCLKITLIHRFLKVEMLMVLVNIIESLLINIKKEFPYLKDNSLKYFLL
jgi:hypothetical protein